MTTIKSRGTITIDVDTCKGCELCITACPPRVLSMTDEVNHLGYRYPQLHPMQIADLPVIALRIQRATDWGALLE